MTCPSFLQLIDFKEPVDKEEDDDDLSESEDSVFSGLEDSGSDSEEDDEGLDEDADENEEDQNQQVTCLSV